MKISSDTKVKSDLVYVSSLSYLSRSTRTSLTEAGEGLQDLQFMIAGKGTFTASVSTFDVSLLTPVLD